MSSHEYDIGIPVKPCPPSARSSAGPRVYRNATARSPRARAQATISDTRVSTAAASSPAGPSA
ncbi:hypothetical protein ACFSTC_15480 [Nonomuraea ferruginea]